MDLVHCVGRMVECTVGILYRIKSRGKVQCDGKMPLLNNTTPNPMGFDMKTHTLVVFIMVDLKGKVN